MALPVINQGPTGTTLSTVLAQPNPVDSMILAKLDEIGSILNNIGVVLTETFNLHKRQFEAEEQFRDQQGFVLEEQRREQGRLTDASQQTALGVNKIEDPMKNLGDILKNFADENGGFFTTLRNLLVGGLVAGGLIDSANYINTLRDPNATEEQKTEAKVGLGGQAVGAVAGIAGGAFAGAKLGGIIGTALGTIFPGIGNVIGGALGLIIGGIGGAGLGALGYFFGDDLAIGIYDKAKEFGEFLSETGERAKETFMRDLNSTIEGFKSAMDFLVDTVTDLGDKILNFELFGEGTSIANLYDVLKENLAKIGIPKTTFSIPLVGDFDIGPFYPFGDNPEIPIQRQDEEQGPPTLSFDGQDFEVSQSSADLAAQMSADGASQAEIIAAVNRNEKEQSLGFLDKQGFFESDSDYNARLAAMDNTIDLTPRTTLLGPDPGLARAMGDAYQGSQSGGDTNINVSAPTNNNTSTYVDQSKKGTGQFTPPRVKDESFNQKNNSNYSYQ